MKTADEIRINNVINSHKYLANIGLVDNEAHIMKIQRVLKAWGYQWVEHIFNDESDLDCSVDFTKDNNPCYFSIEDNSITCSGWGRNTRLHCWNSALISFALDENNLVGGELKDFEFNEEDNNYVP